MHGSPQLLLDSCLFLQNWHNKKMSKRRQSGNPLVKPNQYVLSGKKGVQFPPWTFISFFFHSLDSKFDRKLKEHEEEKNQE